MKYFFVKDGKVEERNEEGFGPIRGAKPLQEVIKDMTPEQLEAIKKERYEKFLKPLLEHNIENIQQLRSEITKNPPQSEKVLWRRSWKMNPKDRKSK